MTLDLSRRSSPLTVILDVSDSHQRRQPTANEGSRNSDTAEETSVDTDSGLRLQLDNELTMHSQAEQQHQESHPHDDGETATPKEHVVNEVQEAQQNSSDEEKESSKDDYEDTPHQLDGQQLSPKNRSTPEAELTITTSTTTVVENISLVSAVSATASTSSSPTKL
ncbi:hypothetical protein HK102_007553, partial [Quaeritorhiza haematococci]